MAIYLQFKSNHSPHVKRQVVHSLIRRTNTVRRSKISTTKLKTWNVSCYLMNILQVALIQLPTNPTRRQAFPISIGNLFVPLKDFSMKFNILEIIIRSDVFSLAHAFKNHTKLSGH
jgi:hypothetical protein